jgi:bifunctional non-homologous end joining protein LigD
MSLREYVRKRRLRETPEPGPGKRAGRRASKQPIFVVQLHHARARHYDFRLEVGGVLKSWAVPKGPSLRPREKRLAVEVEDHPVSYAGFEGDIPEGHYGAGHVDLFDHGTWSTEDDPQQALAAGKLEFELHGSKLRGGWVLVRTRMRGNKQQWLLIKRADETARDAEADDLVEEAPARKSHATARAASIATRSPRRGAAAREKPRGVTDSQWREVAAALPGARRRPLAAGFAPQLCAQQKTPPAGDDWIHETKWDGYRMLADLDHGRVKLRSRKNLDWTTKLPEIAAAIEAMPVESARIDGELVALDRRGRSDFSALQDALKTGATKALRYVVFDLPGLERIDLTQVPLIERKSLLKKLLAASKQKALVFSTHIVGHGKEVFDAARRHDLEGIVSKQITAPYVQARSSSWIKIKRANTDEFVVVGYSLPKGSRQGFGALLLARPEGRALRYVGRVGTGFDDALLKSLARQLARLRRSEPVVDLPRHVPFRASSVLWVEPKLVVEVEFRGWAKEGLLRQASFMRMREDKAVKDLRETGRPSKSAGRDTIR